MDDKGTLATRAFFSRKSDTRRKEIPARIFILVAALAFLVPITVSIFAGAFETEKARVYVVPEDIKGSTSFAEIIDNYSVSRDQFFNSLGIPESTSEESKIKDLTGISGFAVEEEIISREHIALLVERYSDPITSLAEHSKADFVELLSLVESSGLNGSDSVDEVMKRGPSGCSHISSADDGLLYHLQGIQSSLKHLQRITRNRLQLISRVQQAFLKSIRLLRISTLFLSISAYRRMSLRRRS